MAQNGHYADAGLTMAKLVGRLYVGAEGAALGFLVGGPVGGIIGGVGGALAGDVAAQEIYQGTREVLYQLGLVDSPTPVTRIIVTPHPVWVQAQSELIASGVSAASANEFVGKVIDAYAAEQRINPSLTPEVFWAALKSEANGLGQYQGVVNVNSADGNSRLPPNIRRGGSQEDDRL